MYESVGLILAPEMFNPLIVDGKYKSLLLSCKADEGFLLHSESMKLPFQKSSGITKQSY